MKKVFLLYKKLFYFFDKLEDKVRRTLSKYPIWYAIIAGIAVVLFWRGIWHTGDILESKGGIWGILFSGPGSIVLGLCLLLVTGVFVSAFVGDMLVLSGIKKEKKLVDKTEEEVKKEENEIQHIEQGVDDLYSEIDEIQSSQTVLEKKIDEQSRLLQKLLDK